MEKLKQTSALESASSTESITSRGCLDICQRACSAVDADGDVARPRERNECLANRHMSGSLLRLRRTDPAKGRYPERVSLFAYSKCTAWRSESSGAHLLHDPRMQFPAELALRDRLAELLVLPPIASTSDARNCGTGAVRLRYGPEVASSATLRMLPPASAKRSATSPTRCQPAAGARAGRCSARCADGRGRRGTGSRPQHGSGGGRRRRCSVRGWMPG